MTFYLPSAPPPRPANPAPADNAGLFEVMGAAWDAEEIETDAWGRTARTRAQVMAEIEERLGGFEADAPLPTPDEVRPTTVGPHTTPGNLGGRETRRTLDRAGRFAAARPADYGGLPLTEDQLEAEVTRRLQVERDEANEVLRMGGRGAGVAEFVGRGARAATDEIGLAFMLTGGFGGGILRTAGREAALGGAAEAFVLPRMYGQAERLGIPDPDALAQIALGAGFSGALGGGIAAAGRGWAYLTGRAAGEAETIPPGADALDAQAAAFQAETALRTGEPVPDVPLQGAGDTLDLLRGFEGFRARAYWDVTAWRTGFGSDTVTRADGRVERVTKDTVVTRDDAERDLARRVGEFEAGARAKVGPAWDNLSPGAQAALTSVAYNYGSIPDRLVPAIRSGDHRAIASAVLRLAGDNNGVNAGRRQREAAIIRGDDLIAPWRGGGAGATTRAGYTLPDEVVTPAGTRTRVAYEIVDLDDLMPASGRLQPRDRTRAASDEQIGAMAARLDPARLMPSVETDRGAPVVGPDGIVESGNGRVMAIRRAAEQFPDRYDAYRAAIAEVADIPDGVARPVLIARRTGEMDDVAREAFVRESNTSAIARMSATEQAASDAAGLDASTLALFDPGAPLTAPGNRAFARAMLERMPQAERAGLVTDRGALNEDGARRLRQALFARAFDASDLTRTMAELGGGDARALIEALGDAAPRWAMLRDRIAAGEIAPELDVTAQLLDALRLIAAARETAAASKGKLSVRGAIDDALAQDDLIGGARDRITARFVDVFYRGASPRAQADVTAALNTYVDEALRVGTTERRLFAELDDVTPEDILDAIRREDPAAGGAGAGAGAGAGGSAPGRSRPDDRQPGPDGGGAGRVAARPDDAGRLGGPAARDADAGLDLLPTLDVRGVDNAAFARGAADPVLDADARRVEADLRAAIEAEGDIALATGVPGETISARALLDDLAEEQEIADVIAACRTGGRAGG